MSKFWKWSNAVESTDSELILDGQISSETWWGDEVTPAAFREELKQHKSNLVVKINSPGGDVFAGISIYNALREFEHEVTIQVDGIAASIASVIAMAGDKIIMSPGSMMMIHKPWTMAIGDANEMDKVKEVLNSIEKSIVPIYSSRSGKSNEEIEALLEAETWMTATEAVEQGFADEAVEAKKSNFSDLLKNLVSQPAFNMAATEQSMKSLVEKIKAEAIKGEDNVPTDEPTTVETDVEVVEEAETTEVTEPVALGDVVVDVKVDEQQVKNIIDSVKEETMSDTQEIAKDQVVVPSEQPKVEVKDTSADYLKSKGAVEDFARVMAEQAGRGAKDVKKAWANHLETKMGITNPEVLLPPAVIQAVQDAFDDGGEIWNAVNKTGLDVYASARDTVTGENSRAKGYNRDEESEKAEEVITLEARTLRPQFIYKYLTLPREVVKEQRSTGALLNYVLTELPKRIVREVERAIVTGDGRTPGTDYAISSFEAIKADAGDGVFAVEYDPSADSNSYESILRASAEIKAPGSKILVAKTGYVTDALLVQGVNGGYIFQPGTQLQNIFGFSNVVTPDWMDDDTDNDAYIFVPSEYRTVGDNSIESFTNFALKTNTNEYLQEIWAGGGLTALKSGVAIQSVSS